MNTFSYSTLEWIVNNFYELNKGSLNISKLHERVSFDYDKLISLRAFFEDDVKRKKDEVNEGYMNLTDTLFFSNDVACQVILTRLGRRVWSNLKKVDSSLSILDIYRYEKLWKDNIDLLIFFGFQIEVDEKYKLIFEYIDSYPTDIFIHFDNKEIQLDYYDDIEEKIIDNNKNFFELVSSCKSLKVTLLSEKKVD